MLLLLWLIGCASEGLAPAAGASECGCAGPTLLAVDNGPFQGLANGSGMIATTTVDVPADVDHLVVDATLLPDAEGFPAGYGYALKIGAAGALETVLEEGTVTTCGGGSVNAQPMVLHYVHPLEAGQRGRALEIVLEGTAEACGVDYTASIEVARLYVSAM